MRKFQISRINFYLKDLFAGTATSDMIEAVAFAVSFMPSARWRDVTGLRADAVASMASLRTTRVVAPRPRAGRRSRRRSTSSPSRAPRRARSTTTSGSRSWICGRTSRRRPSAPEGIDLLALCQKLLTNAIRPVLKEVNITGALGHIAGAFFFIIIEGPVDPRRDSDVVAHCVEINQCVDTSLRCR